jgi:hypothetical protein
MFTQRRGLHAVQCNRTERAHQDAPRRFQRNAALAALARENNAIVYRS